MSLKIKATTPCYKFINASPEQQLAKIREEVEEVAQAWTAYSADKTEENLKKLFVELLDVKACVNTAMKQVEQSVLKENVMRKKRNGDRKEGDKFIPYISNYGAKWRAKEEVIEKNMRRG